MARPKQIPKRQPLSDNEITAASYQGSKEHKAKRWWGGLPGVRLGKDGKATRPKKQKTTICWLVEEADRFEATHWVREALKNGQCRYYEGDDRYPKHIWYKNKDGQFWFGFLFDSGHGSYKGWPIEERRLKLWLTGWMMRKMLRPRNG
jgi:hypothetical protein